MNDPQKEMQQSQRPQQVPRETLPLADKNLEARVDELLKSKLRKRPDLDVLAGAYAVDANLRQGTQFTARRKLILAEVLSLVADAADPEKKANLSATKISEARQALQRATKIAVGQMLRRLRPVEEVGHQLRIWKANCDQAGDKLPEHHTTIVLVPKKLGSGSMLESSVFHRALDELLKQSNDKIGGGLYRAFLMLPTHEMIDSSSLIPYLRIAHRQHLHVLGSASLTDDRSSLQMAHQAWKLRLADVPASEQEILSDGTIVANQVVIRGPRKEYFEKVPLVCGLHYAFAGHMSQYFNDKKVGQWYIPVLYPGRKPESLSTQNTILTRSQLGEFVQESRICLAYTVPTKEDASSPGVKIYGPLTLFPGDELDDSQKKARVDWIQSQARVTRNRISFYLLGLLEKHVGAADAEETVKEQVVEYLRSIQTARQIRDFKVRTKMTGSGHFDVTLSIEWSHGAESFDIEFASSVVTPTQEK